MDSIEVKKQRAPVETESDKDYQTFRIHPTFQIELHPSPSYETLSDVKKRLIHAIWEKEQKRRKGALVEGLILNAISLDHKKLVGQFVPYKYLLAQLSDPSLKSDLNIVPVSMSGITFFFESLVFARRADWVAQYPYCIELAPSGGIRPPAPAALEVDLKLQILEELSDEIGVEKGYVKRVKFFAAVRDLKNDAVELCAEIKLKPYAIFSSSCEYTQVLTVPCSEIKTFVKIHGKEFVPFSLTLLKLRKLID